MITTIIGGVIYGLAGLLMAYVFGIRFLAILREQEIDNKTGWWGIYAFSLMAMVLFYVLSPKGEYNPGIFEIAIATSIAVGVVCLLIDLSPWWRLQMRRRRG